MPAFLHTGMRSAASHAWPPRLVKHPGMPALSAASHADPPWSTLHTPCGCGRVLCVRCPLRFLLLPAIRACLPPFPPPSLSACVCGLLRPSPSPELPLPSAQEIAGAAFITLLAVILLCIAVVLVGTPLSCIVLGCCGPASVAVCYSNHVCCAHPSLHSTANTASPLHCSAGLLDFIVVVPAQQDTFVRVHFPCTLPGTHA